MPLQLNETPRIYKEFVGRYHEQMPRLIRDGRTPMTVADVMRRRPDVAQGTSALRAAWLDNYFDTIDAVLYHPSGRIKIVRDAIPLKSISLKNDIRDGAVVVDNNAYGSLSGPEFDRSTIITDTLLAKQQVLISPVWAALAGDDPSLLRAYTDLVFSDAEQRFGYTKNMGISLAPTPAMPSVRAWIVGRMYSGSDLDGGNDLGSNDGCLVGRRDAIAGIRIHETDRARYARPHGRQRRS